MRADRQKLVRLLKTARGQVDGVLRMMEEDQYCIDISRQILAAEAVLRRANSEILKAHLEGCVKQAFETGDEAEKQKKIQEIIEVFDALSR